MDQTTETAIMTTETPQTTTPIQRCTAMCQSGKPCGALAVQGTDRCVFHSDSFMEARARGGRNSSRIARLERRLSPRLRPVLELLEKAIAETYAGTLPASRATAIAALAGAIIKTIDAATYESRLMELEEKISEAEDGTQRKTATLVRRTIVKPH